MRIIEYCDLPNSSIPSHCTSAAEILRAQRNVLLDALESQGYAFATIRNYKQTISKFCAEVEKRSLGVADIDATAVESIREVVVNATRPRARTYARFCLGRFVEHLVQAGILSLPAPPADEPTALDRLSEEYDDYLRRLRGLSEATAAACQRYLRAFMRFRFGDGLGDLNAITPDDIAAFLCRRPLPRHDGARSLGDKTMPSHLRTLFKFLFWIGKTTRNLANSVPRVAQPKACRLPRHLRPEEVRGLLEAVRTDDAIGRRNYAILLLIARLGLRATEAVAIRLEDIDWRAGEILIRGKGRLHDRMPLPADVGEAIVDYLRNGRAGTSRALFVAERAPHRPFKNAQIVNMLLREAFRKTGLRPPQKYVGSHVLRHSLAMDMLGKGASLEEIADVLRHRSRVTTMVYARHDIDALRTIARPWPLSPERKDAP